MSMVTKLVRVVTYHKELSPINLYDPSMKWCRKVTSQIKSILSLLVEEPWTTN